MYRNRRFFSGTVSGIYLPTYLPTLFSRLIILRSEHPVFRTNSDVESDDYSESARSYELGKASDFACARPRPDFSAFLCLWRKVTIGWEMRPVRLVLQNIRNFFSQNEWCLPFTKIVGPERAAIRRKVQVRKVREKPGGRLFTTFTDVLRPLTSLESRMFEHTPHQ